MASSISQLLTLLSQKILSGGRQTTAQKVRDFDSEFIDSALNKVDGGTVQGNIVMEGDIIKTDDQGSKQWKLKFTDQGQPYGEEV